MPDVSVVTPAVAVPADRLTLAATDARGAVLCSYIGGCYGGTCGCMAEE